MESRKKKCFIKLYFASYVPAYGKHSLLVPVIDVGLFQRKEMSRYLWILCCCSVNK